MKNWNIDTIIKAMARAMFVTAYADAVENEEIEGETACMGTDCMDVAPPTPIEAVHEAWRLAGIMQAVNNNTSLPCLLLLAVAADELDYNNLPEGYADSFGHYMAMEALGHGVSWKDDHADPGIKFPVCFEYDGPNNSDEDGSVHILTLECRGESDTTLVFSSLTKATDALHANVKDCWAHWMGDEPIPDDPQEAIDMFYENPDKYNYTLTSATIDAELL